MSKHLKTSRARQVGTIGRYESLYMYVVSLAGAASSPDHDSRLWDMETVISAISPPWLVRS